MPLNILVVDDSSVMRAMIIKTLRLCGLPLGAIYEAANGKEALRTMEEHEINLTFADVNMPVMNGEEMLQRLRQNAKTRDSAVIVVSTEGSDTRIEKLRELGAGFVHKPFTPETLREKIISMMGVQDELQHAEEAFDSSGPDF
jgi:two-component system chemotaxis response regulator CheY